ncbi:MAG TPA: hypothetical protein VGR07_21935 [Thermoanaerobaculia bacterium]|jgi:uncharacterized protein (TIGR02646 family)|nr:hypothetical protein [Thermoanaerobaculia bacterium]
MRKLRRPAVLLPTLSVPTEKGRLLADQHVQARSQDEKAALKFPDHWNEPDVRGALYAYHGRACAYCQCDLPANDRGDVEHFRPKSIYWWLAYEFTNYLLSCSTCNRVHKKSRFPLPSGVAPLAYAARAQLGQEPCLLVDPTADPVEEWMEINLKDDLYPVQPHTALAVGSTSEQRAQETIRTFKLNENGLLVQQRVDFVNRALRAIQPARNGNDEKRLEIAELANRYRPHGMAVRQLLTAASATELIPSPEDDLLGLVLDFLATLEVVSKILVKGGKNAFAERQRDEVCWALAVLWKDPPAVGPTVIEHWLEKAGRHAEVAAYYGQL